MATMIPKVLPNQAESNIPQSEREIFEKIRTGPNTKGWVVLHSVTVPNHKRNSYPREVDFLIMKPRGGVVCLEVKGDSYEVREGNWFRKSELENAQRDMREPGHENQSPLAQARDTMFSLKNFLSIKSSENKNFQDVKKNINKMHITCAVAFTSAGWPGGVEKPADCEVYDRKICDDPAELCRALNNLLEPTGNRVGPSIDTIDFIREKLRPENFLMEDYTWINTLDGSLKELVELTEKQTSVLRLTRHNPRVLLEGGAGTGKTVLAIKLAKERAYSGSNVLLVCPRGKLAHHLDKEIGGFKSNVTARSARRFMRELVKKSKNEHLIRQVEAASYYQVGEPEMVFLAKQRKIVADAALEAAGRSGPQFDYLIIDELQWFKGSAGIEVLPVLNEVLSGGLANGHWTMFADFANQSVFGAEESPIELLEMFDSTWSKDQLEENCRNTGNIFQLMEKFDAPDSPYKNITRAGASEGLPVRYRTFANDGELKDLLLEEITRLHNAGTKLEQIIVLLFDTRYNTSDANLSFSSIGQWKLSDVSRDNDLHGDGDITLCVSRNFSGLERDVVIFVAYGSALRNLDEPDASEWFRQNLYIGLSRPKGELIILADKSLSSTKFSTPLGITSSP